MGQVLTIIARMHKLFVKISGDVLNSPELVLGLMEWLKTFKKKEITICCGGGNQINKDFQKHEIEVERHCKLGRRHECAKGEAVAMKSLSNNARRLRRLLGISGLPTIKVIIPIVSIGNVRCHVNGDQMARFAYLGYDELFVVTTRERIKIKRSEFLDLPKITVIGF